MWCRCSTAVGRGSTNRHPSIGRVYQGNGPGKCRLSSVWRRSYSWGVELRKPGWTLHKVQRLSLVHAVIQGWLRTFTAWYQGCHLEEVREKAGKSTDHAMDLGFFSCKCKSYISDSVNAAKTIRYVDWDPIPQWSTETTPLSDTGRHHIPTFCHWLVPYDTTTLMMHTTSSVTSLVALTWR